MPTQNLLGNILEINIDKGTTDLEFSFMTKLQLPNLHQTVANMYPSINISSVTSSTSFELAYSHARVTQIKFNKQELVSLLGY